MPEDVLDEPPGAGRGTPTSVRSVRHARLARRRQLGHGRRGRADLDRRRAPRGLHPARRPSKFTEAGVPVLVEWDPAGLAPRGEDARIERIARKNYTHFVDMRGTPASASTRRLEVTPVDEIAGYSHPARSGEGTHFTELLLLRLTEEQAANAGSSSATDEEKSSDERNRRVGDCGRRAQRAGNGQTGSRPVSVRRETATPGCSARTEG